ncbi:MAG: DUF2306 domain-containing protein [Acidimicrobiia bacterium]
MTTYASRREAGRHPAWRVPAGLLLLSLIPLLAGAARVGELASSPEVTPDNARFVEDPFPVVAHIVGATVWCVLGAFQFVPSLRRGRWHRRAGKVALPFGLVAAASGIWMALFYPLPHPNSVALDLIRTLFGTGMLVALVLALGAILRRDVPSHRAWMIRGYAIGVGAGSQALIGIPLLLAFGEPNVASNIGLHVAGWLVNLWVAERMIRGRPLRVPRPGTAPPRSHGPCLSGGPREGDGRAARTGPGDGTGRRSSARW